MAVQLTEGILGPATHAGPGMVSPAVETTARVVRPCVGHLVETGEWLTIEASVRAVLRRTTRVVRLPGPTLAVSPHGSA
jgi:hypothetical protein